MLKLSEQVIVGLKHLTDPAQRKKLISSATDRIISNGNIPTNPEIYTNDADLVKQSEYAVVCLLFQCVKYNLSLETAGSELQSLGVSEEIIADFFEIFEPNRQALTEKSMMIGHGFPVVSDVTWKLQTQVKGPNENQVDFKINFGDEVEFLCNKEELQKLISQLKEAERHCENFTK